MFKKKKYKRQLDKIGKEKYDFDIKEEIKYYNYLSCSYMKEKDIKNIDDKYKFDSYKKWKQYIYNKYIEYRSDELIEVSRYFNQRIRNTELNRTNWTFFIPILLTIIIGKMFEIVIDINWGGFLKLPILGMVIGWIIYLLIYFVFVVLPTFYMIKRAITPIFVCNTEKYLFVDYKEIVDEMILTKSDKNNCKIFDYEPKDNRSVNDNLEKNNMEHKRDN